MIKRGITVLATMMALLSGVGMVSAFEAHTINVKAHVENAIQVDTTEVLFGTVFPEEWRFAQFDVGFSDSFCAIDGSQDRHDFIFYEIWLLEKPLDPADPTGPKFPWLGDALYFGIDVTVANPKAPDLTPVGPTGPPLLLNIFDPQVGAPSTTHSLSKLPAAFDKFDTITVGIDVPVFEGFWNKFTDVMEKDSGLTTGPTVVIDKLDDDRYFPDGVTLGADIVFQLTGFGSPGAEGCETP